MAGRMVRRWLRAVPLSPAGPGAQGSEVTGKDQSIHPGRDSVTTGSRAWRPLGPPSYSLDSAGHPEAEPRIDSSSGESREAEQVQRSRDLFQGPQEAARVGQSASPVPGSSPGTTPAGRGFMTLVFPDSVRQTGLLRAPKHPFVQKKTATVDFLCQLDWVTGAWLNPISRWIWKSVSRRH